MPTIGQKLGETRRDRGLSIEDVAHETRIHPAMIVRIEEDDFSQFPSVTYARSFIRQYSEHLGLDLAEALDTLNSGVARLGDHEMMGEMKRTIEKDRRFRLARFGRRPRRGPAKRAAPLFLNLILIVLMAALGLFYFLGYNAPTPQRAKEDIARALGLPLPDAPEGESGLAPEPNPLNQPANSGLAQESSLAPPAQGAIAAPPAPYEPGTPPIYPVLKPAVEVSLQEDPPALPSLPPATGAAPRPRETPALDLASDPLRPPVISELPGSRRPEPQAVLRPEGTDPAAKIPRSPEPAQATPARTEPGAKGTAPQPTQAPVRAVPVAASE